MQAFLALLFLVAAIVSALLCGVCLRVLWIILREGPSMAVRAYERGERLATWLDPSKLPDDGCAHRSMSVRVGAFGRHIVEERAHHGRL